MERSIEQGKERIKKKNPAKKGILNLKAFKELSV
jgi:hypothetical protein